MVCRIPLENEILKPDIFSAENIYYLDYFLVRAVNHHAQNSEIYYHTK